MRYVIIIALLLFSSNAMAQKCITIGGQGRSILEAADKKSDGGSISSADAGPMNAGAQSRLLNQLSVDGYIAGVPFKITQKGRDAIKLPECN